MFKSQEPFVGTKHELQFNSNFQIQSIRKSSYKTLPKYTYSRNLIKSKHNKLRGRQQGPLKKKKWENPLMSEKTYFC